MRLLLMCGSEVSEGGEGDGGVQEEAGWEGGTNEAKIL